MEKRINKHVFAWVFCFLLGELGVALRTKRKIFSYKIQKPLLKRNLKKDA